MRQWLRARWGRYYVKIARMTGDGEQIEVAFNERDDAVLAQRVLSVGALLHQRMVAHNRVVMEETERAKQAVFDAKARADLAQPPGKKGRLNAVDIRP